MKILLVADQFFSANNGMTISARRFAECLRAHGNEVRIVSTGKSGDTPYLMQKQYIPVFDRLVTAQGMTFAKPDDELLAQATSWADIVHFQVPFALAHHGIAIARRLGVPYTAAFHVQPENITASIHLDRFRFLNRLIYRFFYNYVYQYCTHIHCPSEFIANDLRKAGYDAKLHVISNGIDPAFTYRKLPKSPEFDGKFLVLMVGRLSGEKRQKVLIDAVARSRYADKIQLVLAGQGPQAAMLRKRAERLPNPAVIRFFKKEELLDLIAMSDLYVHAAAMEIEAMSCMEAFAGGLVPIIADSDRSATPQFAFDSRNLFRVDDSDDLAKQIDYWIEHEEERKRVEREYSAYAKRYNLDDCVRQAEEMFREAIRETRPQTLAAFAEDVDCPADEPATQNG